MIARLCAWKYLPGIKLKLDVAQAFGLSRDYGSLEAGKVANLVVWSGDPLELSTQAERVFVRGVEQARTSRQTELRDRYR